MKYLIAILLLNAHFAFAQDTDKKENNCKDDATVQVKVDENQDCAVLLPKAATGTVAAGTAAAGSTTAGAAAATSTAKVATFAKGLSAKALISAGVGLGALAAIDDSVNVPDISEPPTVNPPVEPPTEPPTTTPSTSDTGTSGTDSTGSTSGTSSTVSG